MNILIPHSWLLEHLDTKASPKEIQQYLSLCGPSVERIYEREGESVYDIEITTNRVDCMSVRGVAREAAVILQQFGIAAKLKPLNINAATEPGDTNLPLPKVINDPALCKRTMGIVLTNVQRTPTPDWMAKRLLQIDQQIHDSVIDLTNYITHELGHPCHAFDYDKIMELGGEIRVVTAKPGKKFTTLDGIEYTTVGGEVVFENQAGVIIDLPAIKGTLNTSINQSTQNVLLWIESMDPKKVRFTSMTHSIRTVAAQLNEKNVDAELALVVLKRGIELYEQLCQAQPASPLYDEFPGRTKLSTITVSLDQIATYLGLTLATDKITTILSDLGCEVEVSGPTLKVTPPTFRPDLTIPADVIEEIARIYGYHNLPSILMDTAIPLTKPHDVDFTLENNIKHFLADIGWQEVYTYSMVSESVALQSGYQLAEHLKLQNPLTDDKVYLRRSLLPSLQEVLAQNPDRKALSVFELAFTYEPVTNHIPAQSLSLSLVSNRDYRLVRGDLGALLEKLFIKKFGVELKSQPSPQFTQEATLWAETPKTGQKVILGQLGVLKNKTIGISLSISELMKVVSTHPTYQPAPKTALIKEDLTFTLPAQTLVGEVLAQLEQLDGLIHKVELKTIYQHNYTFTLSYLSPDRNLSVEDVEPVRKKVVKEVEKAFKAQLVGTV